MKTRLPVSVALPFTVVLVLALAPRLRACLWDHDTLAMERRTFPGALELIAGKFLRHSRAFYQWRVRDRRARIAERPDDLALYDDLAVALDKLGEHAKAIEVMREKEKRSPGLYETQANLGTFLIHGGKLEEGAEFIRRAIEINPDAHFGREKYQLWLVEYVLSKRDAEGKTSLPLLGKDASPSGAGPGGFVAFLEQKLGYPTPPPTSRRGLRRVLEADDRSAAIQGILGMMRFGHHDSPILLEVLGEVLTATWSDENRLGARAFLKASFEVEDDSARKAFRQLAQWRINFHENESLEELETRLREEIADAEAWVARVAGDEARWIREGKDVDAEFDRKYYSEPRVPSRLFDFLPSSLFRGKWRAIGIAVTLLAGAFVLAMLRAFRRWRRSQSA